MLLLDQDLIIVVIVTAGCRQVSSAGESTGGVRCPTLIPALINFGRQYLFANYLTQIKKI